MALLSIRVELARPSRGVEMTKLAALAEETQRFLRMLAEDVGLDPNAGTWVARDFYNQGVGFDVEYLIVGVDQEQVSAYWHAVDGVTRADREDGWRVPGVRAATVLQSAKLAMVAGEGETVRLGHLNGMPAVEWRPLQKDKAVAIIEHYQQWTEYRGMLQGVIHSIYKESNPPYFVLRDYASRELVKCEFNAGDWTRIYKALERKDAVVLVSGWIRARRVDRSISELRVERIQGTKPVNADQLRAFFGSAPGWTGDLTSDQFIDAVRGQEDADE